MKNHWKQFLGYNIVLSIQSQPTFGDVSLFRVLEEVKQKSIAVITSNNTQLMAAGIAFFIGKLLTLPAYPGIHFYFRTLCCNTLINFLPCSKPCSVDG
jgi:hypothetical protein